MAGLEFCTRLEELYLSHNGIWKLEGLSTLSCLRVLDVSSNRISKVSTPSVCQIGPSARVLLAGCSCAVLYGWEGV
jgi:protein phosphatase 1 regulatory subunit 7